MYNDWQYEGKESIYMRRSGIFMMMCGMMMRGTAFSFMEAPPLS